MCQPPGLPELRLYDGGRGRERERDGKRTVESILRHKWFRLRGKREREVSNLDNMRKGWRERWWRDVMPVAG